MITSLLDNDLYKFTMQNAVIKKFPRSKVRFQFINRGKTKFPDGFAEELRRNVQKMENLRITPEEKTFLSDVCYFLDPTYIDFINGYIYDPSEVGIIQADGDLQVSVEGYWFRTILWEVPLMSMISELYFKMTGEEIHSDEKIAETVRAKANRYKLNALSFAEFGTRRRYSHKIQDIVVRELSNYGKPSFIGTSNVYFAMKYNTTPIGTHAHEWFMFHAAKYGFKMANILALEHWVDVYRGNLGIALSDTFTTDVFFRSFDRMFAKLFDGVRHDSGDPFIFTEKTIKHYKNFGIDPKTKSIVFSDGLDPDKVEKITHFCRNRIGYSFGIGTNFTNDVGVKPLNIVIKITQAKPDGRNWVPTIKLSDEPGKHTGDPKVIAICKEYLDISDKMGL